jgi:hypothetical protein
MMIGAGVGWLRPGASQPASATQASSNSTGSERNERIGRLLYQGESVYKTRLTQPAFS